MVMIIPTLHYRDAKRAVTWLQNAFGLEPGMVVSGEGDAIAHAEMFYGDGCVMFGSGKKGEDQHVGPVAAGLYVVVEDVDAHYAKAKAAGAEILYEPRSTDYDSREYGANDFEGNSWSFGTYVPKRQM